VFVVERRPNCPHFFEPIQVDRQLADLLVELGDGLLAFIGNGLASFEELGHSLSEDLLPLRHQQRMHLILARDLRGRFDFDHRLQADFGLEGATVLLAFPFHRSALSHFEQTSKV
jgi:hypothetical protein